jgi:hypothetical protein
MIGVVLLTGYPATGKSTVMRTVLGQLRERPTFFKSGLVSGFHYGLARITILGNYDITLTFPGTDKLSMAVQPDFNALLGGWRDDHSHNGHILLFEGDRLCNSSSLNRIIELQLPWVGFVLVADQAIINKRHGARDKQNATWLAGRVTKVDNLVCNYHLQPLTNNTAVDTLSNAATLLEAVKQVQATIAQGVIP